MKKVVFFIFIIATLLSLSSCTGKGKKSEASSELHVGQLISKKIFDYDNKYGYQISVKTYVNPADVTLFKTTKVWIQKMTFDRLPNPSDSVFVRIEYIVQNMNAFEVLCLYAGHTIN